MVLPWRPGQSWIQVQRHLSCLNDWHKVYIYPAPTKTSVSRESLVSYVTLRIRSHLSEYRRCKFHARVTAVIVSRVTSDLPLQPIPLNQTWSYLAGLQLADPNFGSPGKIDLLLGVEIFADAVLHGRRWGDPGSPVALETHFGWALAGSTNSSRSQAVRRFLSFERSLHSKGLFSEFKVVIDEYFHMGHAELVPAVDLETPSHSVFYMPMHAVRKDSSSTTKVRAVFDASAKTSTGVSLNDVLLVGPTVHSPLVDVLLRFRFHHVALIADVSRMYRAISLTPSDRDLHRFVWRNSPSEPLQDFRLTRVTFGVSSSSYIANMCVKQNALDYAKVYPLAAQAVEDSFYVDDGLTGADSVEKAVELHIQLQSLFGKAEFLLRKWNSSELEVLQHIDSELRDQRAICTFSDPDEYTKTLGVEWNARLDHFRLMVSDLPTNRNPTKRAIASDVARIFDVLGWFAPVTIKAKILLQRLWEEGMDWDETVPTTLGQTWLERAPSACWQAHPTVLLSQGGSCGTQACF